MSKTINDLFECCHQNFIPSIPLLILVGIICIMIIMIMIWICVRVGRAIASVWGDGGSIPTGGALEVWPCDFGPKQFGWLINQLGEP